MSKLAEIYARRERTLKRRERRRECVALASEAMRKLMEANFADMTRPGESIVGAVQQPANSIGAALASKLFG